ncbi:hypothetical protein N7471_010409 [Penicillium samsonianum]|uniref:uncharacterized protein n=1 Tax=Penicillium samsonianum TaxID=1882272 RepID=UPI0025467461|nr:uncharacterized protein N7471_010409 [Penicillium samsonianum]KAJ6125916.1 hypothetical protein N7471_010409 [Penicillium samsonianum]
MLQSAELRWIGAAYSNMSQWIMTPKSRYLINLYRFILGFKSVVELRQWTRGKSVKRPTVYVENDNLFALFCKAKYKNGNRIFTERGIWTESVLLLAAGSDTTSTTMGAIFFYLVHNRESLDNVTESLRSVLKDESEITSGPKLAGCTYLLAYIREAMRLAPAVPNLSPRVVHAEMFAIDGCLVQKERTCGRLS